MLIVGYCLVVCEDNAVLAQTFEIKNGITNNGHSALRSTELVEPCPMEDQYGIEYGAIRNKEPPHVVNPRLVFEEDNRGNY